MNTLGRHLLLEFHGCSDILSSKDGLTSLAIQAAKATGATVLNTICHQFEGGGLTILVMLSESHLSLHTFPEALGGSPDSMGYCACDIFTCGKCEPALAVPVLTEGMKAKMVSVLRLERGLGPGVPPRLVL